MFMPRVSIIIPAYNAAPYVKKTIDSILAQTFSDFECIVIDDGSTDDTVDVVSRYTDSRIKIITQENSGGPAKPRNVGIASALGDLVCIFDSDDIMLPNKLDEYVAVFDKHENIDVLFSDFSLIDAADHCISECFLADYSSFRQHLRRLDDGLYLVDMALFFTEIIKANFIGTSSVCFKRKFAENTTLFNDEFSSGDDILAWVILAKTAQFAFIDKVLHAYRKRDGSISSKNVEKLLINKIHVLQKIKDQLPNSKDLVEITKKANEYYFSLGYLYRKSKRFSDARKAYCSIKGLNNKPNVMFQVVKVYIEELFFFWRG